MKALILTLVFGAILSSCSSFDFLQYRENTGLYVVEKPDEYNTMKFGSRLAATGDGDADYMAVSGGAGWSTLFYMLSEDGKLKDVTDYEKDYPDISDLAESISDGSGSSLAGLPIFSDDENIVKGCVAVGEMSKNEMTIWCSETGDSLFGIKGDSDISNFGAVAATVYLGSGMQSLLLGGGNNGFQLFADMTDRSRRTAAAMLASDNETLEALAGGRLIDPDTKAERIYAAVGSNDDGYRVRLYLLSEDKTSFDHRACLKSKDNTGFGGALAVGDLDGDGADELVVGSNPAADRLNNTVYIFDVSAVIAEDLGDDCADIDDDEVPLMATLTPENGPLDITCDQEDCAFGATVAVGDISPDDDGPEVIVGAFRAEAEGVHDAGAVYIYRGWERSSNDGIDSFDDVTLAGRVTDSTPETGKEFGSVVAVAPIAGRNELLISATGQGKVFIAFCTGVGENIDDGADVTRNESGKVVSTRCRL